MRGATVDLVRSIEKEIFKDRRPRWNINRKPTDKPFLRGSRVKRHWNHLGWGTGKVGSYLPGKKIFTVEPWRLREFVVPETLDAKLKPYVSTSVDVERSKLESIYFTDLFSDELVSDSLKNDPRLLEECRKSAQRIQEYILSDPAKKREQF